MFRSWSKVFYKISIERGKENVSEL